jgi:hypothetical protein
MKITPFCRGPLFRLLLPINSVIGSINNLKRVVCLKDAVPVHSEKDLPALPPVIAGAHTPEIGARVESFYTSVAAIFEAWATDVNPAIPDALTVAMSWPLWSFEALPGPKMRHR